MEPCAYYLKPPSWLMLIQSVSILLNCDIFFTFTVRMSRETFSNTMLKYRNIMTVPSIENQIKLSMY